MHTPKDSFTSICGLDRAGRVEQMEEELLTEQLHHYFISLLQNMYKHTQTPSIFISVPFSLAGKSTCRARRTQELWYSFLAMCAPPLSLILSALPYPLCSHTHHTHHTRTHTPRQDSRWPKVAISHRLGPSRGAMMIVVVVDLEG